MRRGAGRRIGLLVVFLSCSGVIVFGSWRIVAKYIDYRTKAPVVRELLESGRFGDDGLVIVNSDRPGGEYAALELNDLRPGEKGPVFARDLGAETTAALIEAFPDRPVYRLSLRATSDGKVAFVEPIPRSQARETAD